MKKAKAVWWEFARSIRMVNGLLWSIPELGDIAMQRYIAAHPARDEENPSPS